MIKSVYRASHQNGKFNHLRGKKAALRYASGIVQAKLGKSEVLSEKDLIEFGWRFEKVSKTVAGSVGLYPSQD